MRGSHAVLGLLVLSCSGSSLIGHRGPPDGGAGCTKDTDCKGDRICSKGECVSPTEVDASDGTRASGGSRGSNQSGGAMSVGDRDAAAPSGKGGKVASGSGGAPSAGGGTFTLGTGGSAGAGTGGTQNTCSGQAFEAPATPVDMYVMFDQSSSMGDPLPMSNPPTTWWGAAQQAVTNFVNDPRAAGSQPGRPAMSVGIQFFPLGGMEPQSCTANYKTPEVELGLLPGNAAAVAGAIAKHQPTAFTPTAPALSGAIAHMKEWAPKHPGHVPVVVLVTDGFPTECDPRDITDIAQIAATAFNTEPAVRTFVVGFNLGAGGPALKELAVAGGTNDAFLINGGDIGSQFVDAMLSISSTPLACDFKLPTPPAGQPLDVSRISVTFTPNATMTGAQIPKLNGLGDCDLNMNTGWFFDSPTSPTKIEVCPGTCAKLSAGAVRILTGCRPLIGIMR